MQIFKSGVQLFLWKQIVVLVETNATVRMPWRRQVECHREAKKAKIIQINVAQKLFCAVRTTSANLFFGYHILGLRRA